MVQAADIMVDAALEYAELVEMAWNMAHSSKPNCHRAMRLDAVRKTLNFNPISNDSSESDTIYISDDEPDMDTSIIVVDDISDSDEGEISSILFPNQDSCRNGYATKALSHEHILSPRQYSIVVIDDSFLTIDADSPEFDSTFSEFYSTPDVIQQIEHSTPERASGKQLIFPSDTSDIDHLSLNGMGDNCTLPDPFHL
jgi:hypothetical protein